MQSSTIQHEALSRAVSGQSFANYQSIFEGFMAKGIPEAQILPRENVFTYNAWKALGRQVRKGEHGVKCVTFIVCEDKKAEEKTGKKSSFRRAMDNDGVPRFANGKDAGRYRRKRAVCRGRGAIVNVNDLIAILEKWDGNMPVCVAQADGTGLLVQSADWTDHNSMGPVILLSPFASIGEQGEVR